MHAGVAGAALVSLAVGLSASMARPAAAEDPGSQRLYWCTHANGNSYGQAEPCAPGTEAGPKEGTPMVNGLAPGREVAGAAPAQPATATAAPVVAADAAQGAPPAAEASATPAGSDTMHSGRMALLRYLAYGLVVGGVAKLFKRSFWRWFIVGFLLRVVLVSLDWVKF